MRLRTFLAEMHLRSWSSVLIVTSPFHQRRSLWTFRRAARDLGMPAADPGLPASVLGLPAGGPPTDGFRLYVARAPFVAHAGYDGGPLRNAAVDVWDWARELAAMVYYWGKGYV